MLPSATTRSSIRTLCAFNTNPLLRRVPFSTTTYARANECFAKNSLF